MSSQLSGLHSSDISEIVSQSGDRSFFIHTKVLEAQPESILLTTTGAEGKIDLLDWDGKTAARFVEFLYDGGYHVFASVKGPDGKRVPERDEAMGPDITLGLGRQEESGTRGENVLLAHAKMYALGQCKRVEGLKEVALRRLRTVLEEVGWRMLWGYPKGAVDVIEMLGYVYSRTLANSEEPIRVLASTFAAENLERLTVHKEMELLLAKEGGLAVELMEGVAVRLRTAGKKVLNSERDVKDLRKRVAKSDKKVRKLKAENEEKVQQLEATSTERLNKILELEGKVSDMERLLGGGEKPALQYPAYNKTCIKTTKFRPRMLLCIAMASVLTIVATLFIQNVPQTADDKFFRGVCQYYKAHSWAGNTVIDTLGEKILGEACRQHKPSPHLESLLGSDQQGVCQFFEARGWVGTEFIDTNTVSGTLKKSCEDLGYTKP